MENIKRESTLAEKDNNDDLSSKGSSIGKFNTVTTQVIKLIPVPDTKRMNYLSPPIAEISKGKKKKRESIDYIIPQNSKLANCKYLSR